MAEVLRRPYLTLDDAAQRLAWVLGAVALAVAPHVAHLPPWVLALTACCALWRLVAAVRHWRLPPKAVRVVVVLAAVLAVFAGYRTLNGLEAGTALLVLMAGVKLLETQAPRDLTVLLFIAYVLLFAAFLYDQSLPRLPYMLGTAWLLTATLMRVHQSTTHMPMREALATSGRLLLQAVPLAVLFFVLFPRLPGQFWALPARAGAMTGISDEMSPGDVSELSVSSNIAFRVSFAGPMPPPRERYWRGVVLHDFDGRTWRRPRNRFARASEVVPEGLEYDYRVTLEPHNRTWLFGLDMPTGFSRARMMQGFDHSLQTLEPVSAPTSYRMRSHTEYTMPGELSAVQRQIDTALPEARNPRARALAQALREAHADDAELVAAILTMFREQEYFYTLEPPRLEADSVDDFLFNTRRGFCEHFASAFTMLARAAGIPARIVGGYQGGQLNPLGGYLIVRQSDAHAWSEVWLDGRGWTRVDPTAAVAPERIEQSVADALAAGEEAEGVLFRGNRLLLDLQLAWDAVNAAWQSRVVEFDDDLQRSFFSRLGLDDVDWRTLGLGMTAALAGFFAVMSGWLAFSFRSRRSDPVAQVYTRLCRELARKAGLARNPWEGPSDYLARVARARPELEAALGELRALYVNLRYGPLPQAAQLSRLRYLVSQFRP